MAFLLLLLIFGADKIAVMFDSYQFRGSTVVAVVTLYAAALYFGSVAGSLIYRVGVGDPRVWVVGIGLAWSCLLLAVFAGSSVNFFGEKHSESSVTDVFTDWVFKPVLWVMLVGWLPALGLGLLYAAGVKKALGES